MSTANISSLGIGSGIDLSSMLTKLMEAEQQPLTKLQSKISATNTKISAFSTLKSNLATLQDAAEKLKSPYKLNAMGASTGDSGVATATAAFNASAGSYTVKVTNLATAQKSFSNTFEDSPSFTPGTLSFDFSGTIKTVELTGKTSFSLDDILGAINDAGIGVTATRVSGDDGERLIFTGSQTGASGAFTVSATNGTNNGSFLDLSDVTVLDTTTAGLAQSVAQDATFSIDGIAASSASNTVTGKIAGITLNLLQPGTTTLSVAVNSSSIEESVQTFVDAYNTVVAMIKSNSSYDSTTKTAKAFNGDSSIRSLNTLLAQTRMTIPVELGNATYKTLNSLGVSVDKNGKMSLDNETLTAALSTSASDVVKTLNAYGTSFYKNLSETLVTNGLIENRVDGLNAMVKNYNNNLTSLENRLDNIEKRYRAQFSALDTLMSQMQTTSTYLTQQLAQYTKSTS